MIDTENRIENQTEGDGWCIINADCVEVISEIADESVDLSVFSPPYSQLFVYSASERDIGNCSTDEEFYRHFKFVVDGLFRVMKPGRIVAVDCMNIPAMKSRDGFIGIKDFRGDLIRMFQDAGFIFHSEHCIWKDPLIEATRTKSLGLLHKQLCKDSSKSRAGIPQYLLGFRKPGENLVPIVHPKGMDRFAGEEPPTEGNISHERWRRYASPVWMDIRSTRTLNSREGRDDSDEKHICPMALDMIERAVWLWSNENEIVLDPFTGLGSTGYIAVGMGRRFLGSELKGSYYRKAVENLRIAVAESKEGRLF